MRYVQNSFMQVTGITVCEVSCKREVNVHVGIQTFLGILGILAVTVEDCAFFREPVLQNLKDVFPGTPVVDYDGKLMLLCKLQLCDEKLNLAPFVSKLLVVVKSGFSYGNSQFRVSLPLRDLHRLHGKCLSWI